MQISKTHKSQGRVHTREGERPRVSRSALYDVIIIFNINYIIIIIKHFIIIINSC